MVPLTCSHFLFISHQFHALPTDFHHLAFLVCFFSFLSLLLFLLFFKVYSDTHLRKLCSTANTEIKAEWPPLQPTLHLTGFELCMMLHG